MRQNIVQLKQIFSQRLEVHPLFITVFALALIFTLHNATFWSYWLDTFQSTYIQGLMLVAAFFALWCALLAPVSFARLVRYVMAFLVVLSSVTSFYMDQLGVFIDRDMIQNIVSTTFTEGKHLITPSFILWIFFWGIIPAAFILWFKTKPSSFMKSVLQNLLFCVVSLALFVGLLAVNFKGNAAVLRTRSDLKASFQPLAPIVGAFNYAAMMTRSASMEFQQIGLDAQLGPIVQSIQKPMLTVVVVGETARAQNFSLGGYPRDTNAELMKKDIAYFEDVTSCGTATATSLPCMFSKFDRSEYTYELGRAHENVLDIMARAGYRIEWIDNNTGDKDLAARQNRLMVFDENDATYCGEGECVDGILTQQLVRLLPSIQSHTVVVLHQIGSHGPSYYLRYPQAFEKFKPACKTSEFSACTTQEIINAYDNSIAYTDKILADLIDLLQAQEHLTTSLIYVSDHGESLGENGLYLHGAPYFLAPKEQTHVPMLVWLSEAYQSSFSIDTGSLKKMKARKFTHANLFHSLLGMTDVQSLERKPSLDIFEMSKHKG